MTRTTFALALALALAATGCVKKSTYRALEAEHAATQAELEASRAADRAKAAHIDSLEEALAAEQARVAALDAQLARLLKDKAQLSESVAEMTQALEELKRRKAAAEARVAEYRDLLARFKGLIDAGKLKVRIVNGRMVVELRTDILFASGSASLSAEGKEALREVTGVLASIPKREFQVAGHTDNVPIRSSAYRSNWELASARAQTVIYTLVDAGMPPERVSGATYGEYHPTRSNETPDGRAANRRIEIIVVPDLSELPGAEELQKLGGEG